MLIPTPCHFPNGISVFALLYTCRQSSFSCNLIIFFMPHLNSSYLITIRLTISPEWILDPRSVFLGLSHNHLNSSYLITRIKNIGHACFSFSRPYNQPRMGANFLLMIAASVHLRMLCLMSIGFHIQSYFTLLLCLLPLPLHHPSSL